jgi:pimeloyl-ACP methyl ester carboxylesterase
MTAAASVAVPVAAADPPHGQRTHAFVFLHGQPGSAADWQLVTRLLPAHWHLVSADRPGYGSNPRPAGGFAANARDVFAQMDERGVERAVLVGHSYGGGVALTAASLAPHRVEAVVLLASVGPGCLNGWDKLMAAPGIGPLSALVAWRLTPWIARARLARLTRRSGQPLPPGEHVYWQIWAHASRDRGRLWRTFLAEQRALMRELGQLMAAVPLVRAPVLLLADPADKMVPVGTARHLTKALPDARLQLVQGAGHHLPRRAPDTVANALVAFAAAASTDLGIGRLGDAGQYPGLVAVPAGAQRRDPPVANGGHGEYQVVGGLQHHDDLVPTRDDFLKRGFGSPQRQAAHRGLKLAPAPAGLRCAVTAWVIRPFQVRRHEIKQPRDVITRIGQVRRPDDPLAQVAHVLSECRYLTKPATTTIVPHHRNLVGEFA